MDFRRLLMSVVALIFVLSIETMGSAINENVQCKRDCRKETLECSNECRLEEEAIDRPEVLGCLRECKLETEDCENECACLELCDRELNGCNENCKNHPFQNENDRKECHKECSFEDEYCRDSCEGD